MPSRTNAEHGYYVIRFATTLPNDPISLLPQVNLLYLHRYCQRRCPIAPNDFSASALILRSTKPDSTLAILRNRAECCA